MAKHRDFTIIIRDLLDPHAATGQTNSESLSFAGGVGRKRSERDRSCRLNHFISAQQIKFNSPIKNPSTGY